MVHYFTNIRSRFSRSPEEIMCVIRGLPQIFNLWNFPTMALSASDLFLLVVGAMSGK